MRILFVTQMWPSPENPDLGRFLVPLVRELEAQGNEVEIAAISRRGGSPVKYGRLVADSVSVSRRTGPHVVFAHFLFPAGAAGLAAARAARAPLVVMAQGHYRRPGCGPAWIKFARRIQSLRAISRRTRRGLWRLPARTGTHRRQ